MAATASNTARIVNSVMTSIVNKSVMDCQSEYRQNQYLIVNVENEDTSGYTDINIEQVQSSYINKACMASATTSNIASTSIVNNVEQIAESIQMGRNVPPASQNVTEILNTISNEMINETNVTCSADFQLTQIGYFNIKNVSTTGDNTLSWRQEQDAEVHDTCLLQTTYESAAYADLENSVEQIAKSESKGVVTALALLLVAMVLLILAGFLLKKLGPEGLALIIILALFVLGLMVALGFFIASLPNDEEKVQTFFDQRAFGGARDGCLSAQGTNTTYLGKQLEGLNICVSDNVNAAWKDGDKAIDMLSYYCVNDQNTFRNYGVDWSFFYPNSASELTDEERKIISRLPPQLFAGIDVNSNDLKYVPAPYRNSRTLKDYANPAYPYKSFLAKYPTIDKFYAQVVSDADSYPMGQCCEPLFGTISLDPPQGTVTKYRGGGSYTCMDRTPAYSLDQALQANSIENYVYDCKPDIVNGFVQCKPIANREDLDVSITEWEDMYTVLENKTYQYFYYINTTEDYPSGTLFLGTDIGQVSTIPEINALIDYPKTEKNKSTWAKLFFNYRYEKQKLVNKRYNQSVYNKAWLGRDGLLLDYYQPNEIKEGDLELLATEANRENQRGYLCYTEQDVFYIFSLEAYETLTSGNPPNYTNVDAMRITLNNIQLLDNNWIAFTARDLEMQGMRVKNSRHCVLDNGHVSTDFGLSCTWRGESLYGANTLSHQSSEYAETPWNVCCKTNIERNGANDVVSCQEYESWQYTYRCDPVDATTQADDPCAQTYCESLLNPDQYSIINEQCTRHLNQVYNPPVI